VEEHVGLLTRASGLFASGRWVDESIEHDARAIGDYLREAGYARVTVTPSRRWLEPGSLEVVFAIDTGPRRMVGSLAIEGAPPELENEFTELRSRLRLLPGRPYVASHLADDRRELLATLARHGYPRAEVNRRLRVPFEGSAGEASLVYAIEPGPRTQLGGYLIRGAIHTRTRVIEQELRLEPGTPIDLVALSEAERRLRALGVFASVAIRPLGGTTAGTATTSSAAPGVALSGSSSPIDSWVMVALEERRLRTLDFVGSFATDDLFSIGADYRDSNLFGRAIHTTVALRLSNASEALFPIRIGNTDLIQGSIQAPHPFGLPFEADLTGLYNFQDKPLFTYRQAGGSGTLFRVLSTQGACALCAAVVASFSYQITLTSFVLKGSPNELTGTEKILATQPNETIARVIPRFQITRVDSTADPRSGYLGDLRFELAHRYLVGGLSGAPAFWRALGSLAGYVDLGPPFGRSTEPESGGEPGEGVFFSGPVVVALGVAYGVAFPFAGTTAVPLSETFAYGGDLSVRGIEERASQSAFPGANYLLTSSLELRWYFYESPVFGALQAALLTDLGLTGFTLSGLFREPTITVGASLRYVTAVGPISIAYAVPVVRSPSIVAADPNAEPSSGRFHVVFGYSF
jgi:outer membrane protein assembly factor BamA